MGQVFNNFNYQNIKTMHYLYNFSCFEWQNSEI